MYSAWIVAWLQSIELVDAQWRVITCRSLRARCSRERRPRGPAIYNVHAVPRSLGLMRLRCAVPAGGRAHRHPFLGAGWVYRQGGVKIALRAPW